jgi:hypothetical protein
VTSTVEFLRRVLPDEGWYCAWQLEGKRNRFFRSAEDLAHFILDADEHGRTAYHAINSFQVATRRTGENAAGARSFYLDLDAGPDKPYLDQPAAIAALRSFCGTLSLPSPTLVNSGHGLHVYWPLERTLDPATWRRYADGLKSLCVVHGLHADPARSSDIASILRTPGTHNRKNGAVVPVVAGLLTGPFQLEQFEVFKNAGRISAQPTGQRLSPLASALGDSYGDVPSDAALVADQCRQLGEMRRTRGLLQEPVWHACLGVLAHCTEGDRYGHEWSTGDQRYDARETQAKLDRQRALGPTTCERFATLNPAGCSGCPHWGQTSSPIQLGRHDNSGQLGAGDDQAPTVQAGSTGQEATREGGKGVVILPKGFAFKAGSLVFQTSKEDRTVDVVVVKHSLQLDTVQFGEMGGDHAYVFRQQLPKEPESEFSIAAATFLGQGGRGEMAKRGANILEWNHFVKYVMGAVDIFREQHRTMVRYEQFGWKGDEAFLYGQVLYTKTAKQTVLTTHDLQVRSVKRGVGPVKGGSLERWTAAANMLFAKGLETQSIALLASFAAPLIRFQERDEGGAVLHLMSSKSAQGKTTALIAAASVWGQIDAFRIKKDDTVIGRLLVLATLSNLPVLYDEIMTRDPDAIYDFVVSFTNGADRTRATRTGEIKHNEARWQTLMLSAGNTSLREVLASGDKPDTQAHRVMELEAVIPEEIAKHYSEEIKDNLRKNAGYAGDVYIDYVVQNLEVIKKLLHDVTDKVRSDTMLPQEYRFWVRTIGAIVCAGLIVKKLGLVEFSPDRIYAWIKDYVRQHRTGTATSNNASEIENLAKFYNDHISCCLPVAGPFVAGRQLNMDIRPVGKLYMRREQSTLKLFIATSPFRDWCIKNGIHFKGLIDVLFDKRVIKNKNRFVTLGAGTPLSAGQTRCLEVDLAHEAMTGMLPEPERRS